MNANAMDWVAGRTATQGGGAAPIDSPGPELAPPPKIRVAHLGTGATGAEALKGILRHPDLELASLWVTSPDKIGRDAGELVGLDHVGIKAVGSLEAALASQARSVELLRKWARP